MYTLVALTSIPDSISQTKTLLTVTNIGHLLIETSNGCFFFFFLQRFHSILSFHFLKKKENPKIIELMGEELFACCHLVQKLNQQQDIQGECLGAINLIYCGLLTVNPNIAHSVFMLLPNVSVQQIQTLEQQLAQPHKTNLLLQQQQPQAKKKSNVTIEREQKAIFKQFFSQIVFKDSSKSINKIQDLPFVINPNIKIEKPTWYDQTNSLGIDDLHK